MNDFKYSRDHEWILMQADGIGVVGITDYAQEQLGDIVFVELPERGRQVNQGEDIAVIESVKTASDIKAPVSGEVTDVNQTLDDTPETVNSDPTGEGWIMKIRITDASALDTLMSEEEYKDFIAA